MMLVVGCEDDARYVKSDQGWTFREQTLEGCEYLISSCKMAHKGNCKNPIHPENWPNK